MLLRDSARKEQIVFQMHMPVQIALEGIQAMVKAHRRRTSLRPRNKAMRGCAHLAEQCGGAFVLVDHGLDGTLD